jgi:hypothetical protein
VKVQYKWHALYKSSLHVDRILSCADKTLIHCELPDGSIAAFPSWMMDVQVCSQLTEGPPQLSPEALSSLRSFLRATISESEKFSEPTLNNQGDKKK